MLGAHATGVDAVCFAGFGERVVAAVEILALLQVLGKMVGSGWELAVETEEALLLGGEGADVDLVLLVGIHDG
jgi:ABC-type branched-subunit amino acid transport system substrate-binding protein